MTDITPTFNSFLKPHETRCATRPLSLETLEDFLKEAYRINSLILTLHAYLKNIRQSYLSTAQPRRTNTRSSQKDQQEQSLTDREREQIDGDAKKMLRELNASIKTLASVEKARADIEAKVIQKKFGRALGALGAWAAGGAALSKSPEQTTAEEQATTISTHRDSVLWLLRIRLQDCMKTQQDMMEIRINREMEKNRSVLAKAKGQDVVSFGAVSSSVGASSYTDPPKGGHQQPLPPEETSSYNTTSDLTAEQIQMFEREQQDMLSQQQSTMDQVRKAEQTMMEIAEIQSQIIANLETQSAGIEQLVSYSELTAGNVQGGNRQLQQATKKASPAKYTFFATCGLCAFLVAWDLI
ncbi:snare-complex protein syntaxin-18, partial [Xylariaceae sp. FL0255]